MNNGNNSAAALNEARDQFVSQWGVIGSAWGVNRTMAQIHALLITAPTALSTDDIMAELKISRGNAHSNLRDLVSWGLVRTVVRKGVAGRRRRLDAVSDGAGCLDGGAKRVDERDLHR